MIPYIGDFAEDATVYHYFNTFDSNDPSASVTITNLVDGDLKVHKDGNTTEAVTSGATITIDFDTVTGTHLVTIDTSVDAFYATGSDYMVRMEGTTVDGAPINAALFTFSIQNRYDVVASVTGAVGSVTGAVGSVTGAVGSVTGNVGGNVVGSVASVTAGVTLAAGAVTNASLAGNMEIVFETDFATNYNATRNAWVTNAQDFVGTTASDPFNGQVVSASVTGNVGGNVTGSVGSNLELGPTEVNAQVDTALADIGLDHLISSALPTNWATDVAAGSVFDNIADDGTASYDRTTDSLQAVRDHVGNGTNLTEAGGTGDHLSAVPWNAAWDAEVQSEVNDGLTAYNAVATTDLPANFASTVISAGGIVDVNVQEIDSISQAATNLEILTDGNEAFYSAYAGPRGPGVYIDDTNGTAGSTIGVHGTAGNPTTTIASAITLAGSLGVNRVYLVANTDITLAATMEDYEFVGIGDATVNSVALASQDVDRSAFFNLTVSGVQGGTERAYFERCIFGTATLHLLARWCGLTDAVTGLTMSNNDDNVMEGCFSMVPGNSAPIIIGNGASLDLSVRHYSGGLELKTLSATATVSVETDGQIIINADSSTSATVTVRGNATITDNAGLGANLTDDAVYNTTAVNAEVVDALATDTYAELGAVPAATSTLADKINWLFLLARNKMTSTSTTQAIRNDADGADVATSTHSDSAGTFTRGEWG